MFLTKLLCHFANGGTNMGLWKLSSYTKKQKCLSDLPNISKISYLLWYKSAFSLALKRQLNYLENFNSKFERTSEISRCMSHCTASFWSKCISLAGVYLLKVNNGNKRTISEICSKLTITETERGLIFSWKHEKTSGNMRHHSVFFVVNFEQISLTILVFLLLTLNK